MFEESSTIPFGTKAPDSRRLRGLVPKEIVSLLTVQLSRGTLHPDVNTGLQIVTTELDDGLVAFWELGTVDWTLFYSNEPTVGIGFEYYVMSLGDRLNDQIAEGLEPIVTNLGPPRMAPFAFGQEQDPDGGNPPNFHMGFMLGGDNFEGGTYGWVEFENDGNGVLSVASSATAFDEGGIIVGTAIAIPEPSGGLLLGVCALMLFQRCRCSLIRV